MYCKNCGAKIPDDALFCPSCGTRTGMVVQETPAETTEAAVVAEEILAPAGETLPLEEKLDSILDREAAALEAPAQEETVQSKPGPAVTDETASASEPVNTAEQTEPQPEPVTAAPQPEPQPEPVRTADQTAPYSQTAGTTYQSPYQNQAETTYQSPYNQGVAPVKVKKKKKTWVVLLILLLVLGTAGYFGYPILSNQINYNKAVKLYDSGDYAQALPLFEELAENGFKDSLDYQHRIVYSQALDAYDAGNFGRAIPLFDELAKDDYRDAQSYLDDIFHQMLANIQNGADIDGMLELNSLFAKAGYPGSDYIPDYAEACRLYADGHYYDAYLLFDSISGFEDASDRAQSCILPTPSSGVVYSNGASGSVDLKVVAPEWYDTYIKIYKDGELCRTMFIRKGESATTYSIPAGTYTMNVAYEGFDGYWFGPDDMFGDDGSYSKLLLDGVNYATYLEGGYTYTLTLMSGGGEGTDVGSTDAGREDI